MLTLVFFFFSSRRRHTRFDCDWSSDVCSSDLSPLFRPLQVYLLLLLYIFRKPADSKYRDSVSQKNSRPQLAAHGGRSEERRVGKEWRSRWSPYHLKKKK